MHNTRFVRINPETVGIKLHQTVIITLHENGTKTLNTDGWETATTKQRFNHWGGDFQVYQTDHVWYLSYGGKAYLYQDDIALYDGNVYFNGKPYKPYSKAEEKAVKALKRRITNYCKAFAKVIMAGKLPKPSGGDCWFCCLVDQDGKTMGDHSGSEHLLEHMREKYYVPSLFYNALKEFDGLLSMVDKHNLGYALGHHNTKPFCAVTYTEKQVAKVLGRYMRKRLGLAI